MTPFDPTAYWTANGPYLAGPGENSPEHEQVQIILRDVLNSITPIKDVLDVGCGRGRLAALLSEVLPKAKYAGVDFGPQIAATAKVRPDGEFYISRIQDFEPKKQWDLLVCSEVLMHVPPADIAGVCAKLRLLARKWIITVDWTEPMDGEIAEWNWRYDYPSMLGQPNSRQVIGLQTVFLFKP